MQEISKWAEKSRAKGTDCSGPGSFICTVTRALEREKFCVKSSALGAVKPDPVPFINHLPRQEKGACKTFATRITAAISSSFSF